MRHFFAFLFIALLVLAPSCNKLKEKGLFGKKTKTLEMLKAEHDSIMLADSLKRIENRLEAAEEAIMDSILQAVPETEAYVADNKYNLIVGSYVTSDLAQACAEKYRKLGYDTRIINDANNKHELVVVESYDQYDTAKERLKLLQNTIDPTAWLYIKE
jgi:hypothetical protein